MASVPLTVKDYRSDVRPTWCPGCGDFGVLSATFKALAQLQLKLHETVVVSGIGCSSRIPYFLRTYGLHGLHGRSLPLAQGVKLANPALTVVAFGGDGDLFSIGAGHMPHAANRNVDITCVLMDNAIYGLTKGQTSPTSPAGHKTKSTPYGSVAQPLNPVLLALSYGASFVARAYSAKPQQLTEILVRAIRHKGFAFVAVESPCTEFNNTFNYLDSVVEDLPPDHDVTDLGRAIELARHETRKHLGVFYQVERPTFEEAAYHLVDQSAEFDPIAYLQKYA
ncbi:MAG: 2-oxoacid:ferredoxin oxidoreductase subunit beta [Chloroflexi bacterium]|nr:2-oxoacid:ferredoxin oxidoreductase subunit beta [Chloroflexota bacterium]